MCGGGTDERSYPPAPLSASGKNMSRQLGEDHEVAFLRLGLIEQVDHSPHHGLSALGLLDRPGLGGSDT